MLTPTTPPAGAAIRGTVTRTTTTGGLFVALPSAPGFEVPALALTGLTPAAGETVLLLALAGTGDLVAVGTLP